LAINRSFLSTKKERKKKRRELEVHSQAYNQAIKSFKRARRIKHHKTQISDTKPVTEYGTKATKIHNPSHPKPNRITTLSKSTKLIWNLHKASHSRSHFQEKVVFHFLDPGLTLTFSKILRLSCSTSALIYRDWACLAQPRL
jgi:hypothetical protein